MVVITNYYYNTSIVFYNIIKKYIIGREHRIGLGLERVRNI